MSAAVDSRLNGHAEGTGGPAVGPPAEEDRQWEEQFLPSPLRLDDHARALKVSRRLAGLQLCGASLRRVASTFARQVRDGLAEKPSSLQMENTYLPEMPDGTEEGVFLALDLGGTNFRILLLELRRGQLVQEIVKHYHISDALRVGEGEALFQFLADCVQDFLRAQNMEHDEHNLGFTFSFPMKQHSISSGELITWTKSFKCSGMSGVDVAALLQRCLRARGLRVRVRVLLNDTTGTLVAGAHLNPHTGIGVILGTGSNGCYLERAARVAHWEGRGAPAGDVVVDVEWGAFGDDGCLDFIKTEFDREVDDNSLLAKSFTFEKYIGGKYLGCVLTGALRALAADGLFPVAPAHKSLDTATLSLFEEENMCGATERTLAALAAAAGGGAALAGGGAALAGGGAALAGGGAALSADDARVAQHVAHLVSNRAAQLAAVCIATLLERMRRAHVAVAVDGSVFKRHPRIRRLMDSYIRLLAPAHSFTLFEAEDGSGKGSALTAAIAARIHARTHTHTLHA